MDPQGPQVRVFIFITWYKGKPAWTHALEGPHTIKLKFELFLFYIFSNLENVDNIDKDDLENPQLVVEYVNEIYEYLRQLETLQGEASFI